MENLFEYENNLSRRVSDYEEQESRPLRRSTDRVMQQASAFVASLEIIGDGVLLLDSNSKVSFSSRSARLILQKIEAFVWISNDELCFSNDTNKKHLNKVLEKIQQYNQQVTVSEVMVITRANLSPIILSLCSLSSAGEEPRLMIIFRDPDMAPTPQWEIFTRHFHLTAQEAKLSLALADGLSIIEYSEAFHLSPHTARTHLKSIFVKTSTRRQSDLLRLIFAFTRL